MKNHVLIAALLIAVLAGFTHVPPASAEPLTIMAIVGVATVLSVSTVDIVASHYDDNRDYRAQQDETDKMRAQTEANKETPSPTKIELAAKNAD